MSVSPGPWISWHAHTESSKTLAVELDRWSRKTMLRSVRFVFFILPLHPPCVCVAARGRRRRRRRAVTLRGYRHGSLFPFRPPFPFSGPRSFLFESSTSAYFLGTYDRPRVVLFCLAAWAGAGRRRELRGHLHLPITLPRSLLSFVPSSLP